MIVEFCAEGVGDVACDGCGLGSFTGERVRVPFAACSRRDVGWERKGM